MYVIGHRGARGHAPENTLASIDQALALGAKHLEVDVWLVDGQLVVFHDQRLERTTNGEGFIEEQSFDQLRKLDAGQGQRIPTLQEVLSRIDSRAALNIELKGPGTAEAVAAAIHSALKQGWSNNQFLVSSFNHKELQYFANLAPEIPIGVLLLGLPMDNAALGTAMGAYAIHCSLDFIDQELVDDAHRRNLRLFVYTVNHPAEIARLQAMNVDAVFSDYPERISSPSAAPYWQ